MLIIWTTIYVIVEKPGAAVAQQLVSVSNCLNFGADDCGGWYPPSNSKIMRWMQTSNIWIRTPKQFPRQALKYKLGPGIGRIFQGFLAN